MNILKRVVLPVVIIVAGVGKSGHIGQKIAASLASTGTPSFFLHPTEASHGDLGMVVPGSVVIAISYSGESRELVDLLRFCKGNGIPLIGMTRSAESTLGRASDVLLEMPVVAEACPNGLAPTSSTTMALALGDALTIVLMINAFMFVAEMSAGVWSGSQALKADALDFLGDGAITFLGLLAIGWRLTWRARSAMIQGVFLGLLGLGVVGSTIWRVLNQTTPEAGLMGAFAVGALIVNILAVLPLLKHRKGDANMRAVWLFSRNDAIGNVAVVIAAGLVAWLGSAWPDLIVAFAIAGLFLHSSWVIIRDARNDLKEDQRGLR